MATTAVLRHRRDTAANWTSNNPVLQAGQLGYETDTLKFKFGNGSTAWISLSYASSVSTGGISDGDKGDIVVSGSGATWTIDTGVVSTSKMGGDVTTAGKALLDDADATAQRVTLGLGSIATQNANAVSITGGTLTGVIVSTGAYSSNVNETLMRIVRKSTAGTITKGQAVYVVGSTGTHLTVELADASSEATAATTIGIAAETITNTSDGYMLVSGLLTGLSTLPTASFTDGDILWLSETAGDLTATRPTQPAHGVAMGWVINANNGSAGSAYIKVINGQELNELHDVLIVSATADNVLMYDTATSLWKNRSAGYLSTLITGFASASHAHSTGDITSGIFAPSFLGSGSPSSTNFLRGDGSWAAPAGVGGGVAIAASTQTATSGTINFANSNGITFGMSGSNQITASYTPIIDYVQSFNGNTGNVSLTVGNGLSLSIAPGFPEYTINLATNITTSLQNFSLGLSNLGNTAGNTGVTGTRIVLVGSNNISLSQATNTAGATITIDQAGASPLNFNLSGNVSGNTTASGNTLNFSGINVTLSGTNNSQIAISAPATSSLVGANGVSISSNGSTISVFNAYISSFENTPFQAVQTMSLNMASVSHAAIFNIPEPLSISYLRIPVLMTTNSTTIATTGASNTGGAAIYSTFNAVVYSIGTGGNSLSLQSVASGSAGFTFSNSISIATNGTQYSLSQGYSAQALGGGTTLTTQTSASTTNYAFSTNSFTAFTSARFLDIPFARSLVGGPYWIVFGGSTSSAATTGVAGLSAMTNCNVRYSNHYGVSQTNLAFGVMGSSNLTSGGYFGAGSFSTAGGGTTNSINLSQISSSASHVRLYFQMLRFA